MTPTEFRARRKALWRSQAAAAKALGVSPKRIWICETGPEDVSLTLELALLAREAGLGPAAEAALEAR